VVHDVPAKTASQDQPHPKYGFGGSDMTQFACIRCRDDDQHEGLVFVEGRPFCNYHADRELTSEIPPPPPTESERLAAKAERDAARAEFENRDSYQKYLDERAARGPA
jgi:hypothetical protein